MIPDNLTCLVKHKQNPLGGFRSREDTGKNIVFKAVIQYYKLLCSLNLWHTGNLDCS